MYNDEVRTTYETIYNIICCRLVSFCQVTSSQHSAKTLEYYGEREWRRTERMQSNSFLHVTSAVPRKKNSEEMVNKVANIFTFAYLLHAQSHVVTWTFHVLYWRILLRLTYSYLLFAIV